MSTKKHSYELAIVDSNCRHACLELSGGKIHKLIICLPAISAVGFSITQQTQCKHIQSVQEKNGCTDQNKPIKLVNVLRNNASREQQLTSKKSFAPQHKAGSEVGTRRRKRKFSSETVTKTTGHWTGISKINFCSF